MTIDEKQDRIIKEFMAFDDWFDKYEHLIELGKTMEPMDKALRKEENRIGGCQSTVWVAAEMKNGKMVFSADSDTLITKGIIALLLRVFDQEIPKNIIDADLCVIEKTGLRSNLSPARANGVAAVINRIMDLAKEFEQ